MPFAWLANDTSIPYPNAGQVYSAGILFPILGVIVTALRLQARTRRDVGFGIDDWLIIPAVVATIGMGICLIVGAAKGVMGYPTPPPNVAQADAQTAEVYKGQTTIQQLEYAFIALQMIAFGFIKLSVLTFYRRVFVVGRSWFSILTYLLVIFSVGWTLAFFLTQILSCGSTPARYWGPLGEQKGHCVYGLVFLVVSAVTDFVSDCVIFFLPLPVIWKLQMSLLRKAAASLVLALGALSLLGAGIKMAIMLSQLAAGYSKPVDLFLTITVTLYWTMIEAGVAIIAMNLPTLHHFLTGRTVQSVVNSLRSVVSLQSFRSASLSNTAGKGDFKVSTKHGRSERSDSELVGGIHGVTTSTTTTEVRATDPAVDVGHVLGKDTANRIFVTQDVTKTSDAEDKSV